MAIVAGKYIFKFLLSISSRSSSPFFFFLFFRIKLAHYGQSLADIIENRFRLACTYLQRSLYYFLLFFFLFLSFFIFFLYLFFFFCSLVYCFLVCFNSVTDLSRSHPSYFLSCLLTDLLTFFFFFFSMDTSIFSNPPMDKTKSSTVDRDATIFFDQVEEDKNYI